MEIKKVQYMIICLRMFLSQLEILGHPVPRLASVATWARARASGVGLSQTHQYTATCPLKGLRDPEEMAME